MSQRDRSARLFELVRFTLRPQIKSAEVYDNLPFSVDLNVSPIHGPWRGTLKVDSLTVVTATVAGTLKFVLAGLPIGSTSQMSANSIDNEQPIGGLCNPDSVLLLPFGINSKRVIVGRTNAESG